MSGTRSATPSHGPSPRTKALADETAHELSALAERLHPTRPPRLLAGAEAFADTAAELVLDAERALIAELADELKDLAHRQLEGLDTFNIVLFGRTGVGKSSLLEALSHGGGGSISPSDSDWTTTVNPAPRGRRSCGPPRASATGAGSPSARLQAEEDAVRLDAVLDEGRRHGEVLDLVQEELDAVDRAARSRLRETIYDKLLSGVILTDDRDAQRTDVEVALDATITAWLSEWVGKLDDLARRAATEQRVRAQRPGADALRQYLDDLFDAIAEEIVAGGSGAQTWARAVESMRDAFTAARVAPDVLAQTEERRADLVRAVEGLKDLLSWADAARA